MIGRYLQLHAARAQLLVAGILTAMFTLLDFVEQLAMVGQGNYRPTTALAYVLLTMPHRLLQVIPVSMLLGSLLALGTLNRRSELTAIRSAGVSEARIIGSVALLVIPTWIGMLLLAEFIVPPAQSLAQEQRLVALASAHVDSSFWAYGNDQYLNVQRFDGLRAARDVDIFAFDKAGSLTRFIHADRADLSPDDNWRLTGVVERSIRGAQSQTMRVPSLVWPSFISAAQTRFLRLPLETMPPVALYRYVRYLKQLHQPVGRYEQELWTRIGVPLIMAGMIMITAPFVFGQMGGSTAGYQIVAGAAVGIVFSLVQQITWQAGILLDLSPAVTALAPPVALLLLASYWFQSVGPIRGTSRSDQQQESPG